MAVDVADGEDVADVRPQVLIDGDRARLGPDPGRLQVQLAGAGGPADREEHGVRERPARGLAAAVIDADRSFRPTQARDEGARDHGHPPAAERAAKLRRHVLVGGRDQDGAALEQGDGSAKIGEDGRDLAAGIRAADHRDPARQAGQGRDVLVSERQVGAGDRKTGRVPADGQDDAVRGPGPAPVRGQRARPGEADRAEVLDQVDAAPSDMAGQVLLVMGVAGHPLAVGEHGGQVGNGRLAGQAEGCPGGPVTRQPGRARQRPHRRRAGVEAGPANLSRLEQGDPRAEFAGQQGGGDSGRAAADHQHAGARGSHWPHAPHRSRMPSAARLRRDS